MIQSEKKIFFEYIGKKIALYRKEKKLTQDDLSLKINRSRVSIVNIEKGKQMPSVFLLWHIASVLDVSINDLLPPANSSNKEKTSLSEEIHKQENLSEEAKSSIHDFLDKI